MSDILIVTYYWPPDSGPGVQRILKFCKYLKAFGHEPVVVTRCGSRLRVSDQSLIKDTAGVRVQHIPHVFDPVTFYNRAMRRGTAAPKKKKRGAARRFVEQVVNFIWLNLFIPDSKVDWYFAARRKIDALLKKETFDIVITTGPPYSVHLIGLYIKKRHKLPWIVDVRDPWLENPSYNVAYRFGLNKSLNKCLEKRVLAHADTVITVGENLAALLRSKNLNCNIEVIYNGYDPEDLNAIETFPARLFRLGYYGNITKDRIPHRFLKGLSQALRNNDLFSRSFILDIFGNLTEEVADIVTSNLPDANLKIHGHVSHDRLIGEYGRPQVLLLLINHYRHNNFIITGKLFEYLYSGWPILGIGPGAGEAAQILKGTKSGRMFPHEDGDGPVAWILRLFEKWRAGGLERKPVLDPIFNRREQARRLAGIISDLTGGK